jgi:Zn finger protein HypA/HybF involved in hydrogenase expression
MANEPIDEQNYLYGVNVVDIGDLRVSRGLTRRPHSSCHHARISYDHKERRIWCRDCEHDLDPFDAFTLLVEWHDRAAKDLHRRREALEEAERHQIVSVAAKTIDKAWRSRKMVPACPSCGNGLFPEDFKSEPAMLGRDYAEARRKRRPGP